MKKHVFNVIILTFKTTYEYFKRFATLYFILTLKFIFKILIGYQITIATIA